MCSWRLSFPAAGERRVDAILSRSEPRLDSDHGRQVVRLLGRIERRNLRAWRHRLADGRAGIGQEHTAGIADDFRVTEFFGLALHGARGEDPQVAVGADLAALEQPARIANLLE